MTTRRVFLGALAAATVAARVGDAAPRFQTTLKTVRLLPRTEREAEEQHERLRAEACDFLPGGEIIERKSFVPEQLSRQERLPIPTARQAALSVGLEVSREDQADLPRLSAGRILSYIDGHYVCVLARVQRDLANGLEYLHHRPVAATATFRGPATSEEFTELVSASVRDMRSMGLFLPSDTDMKAENLRTLVMLFRSTRSEFNEISKKVTLRPTYEFVFIRARGEGREGRPLQLHSFVTTEDRQQLHSLANYSPPTRSEFCDVRGRIFFTDYKLANLLPSESATRQTIVRARETYAMSSLHEYAAAAKWSGDALDNLTATLDAIIDRRIPRS